MKGKVVVYNPVNHQTKVMAANEIFSGEIPSEKYVYYIISPVTNNGIAFFGDENKITATGKKRIAEINNSSNNLQVKILFAKGENEITLCGYYQNSIKADKGKLSLDPATHLFKLVLRPPVHENIVVANFKE